MMTATMQAHATPGLQPVAPQSVRMNIVRIVNEHPTETFERKYGPREKLILPPGSELYVQEEVAWHFTGRWFTDNSNPKLRERATEFQRLTVFYGVYENRAEWERHKPKLAVYAPDGTRIVTVLDDPDGVQSQTPPTALGREEAQQRQLDFLQSEMVRLQAEVDRTRQDRRGDEQPVAPSDAAPKTPEVIGGRAAQPSRQIAGMDVPVAPQETVTPAPPTPDITAPVPPVPELPGETVLDQHGNQEQAGARLPVNAEPVPMPDDDNGDVPADAPPDSPQRQRVGTRVGEEG